MKKTKLEKIETQINNLKAKKKTLEKENINKIAKAIIKAGYGSMPVEVVISKLKEFKVDGNIPSTPLEGRGTFSKFLGN